MSGVIFCERKHTLINNVNNNIKLFAANWRKKNIKVQESAFIIDAHQGKA